MSVKNHVINPNQSGFERLQEIELFSLRGGETLRLLDTERETAVLMQSGKLCFRWQGMEQIAGRKNVFEEAASCLHVCRDTELLLEALEDSEILVQKVNNPCDFPSKFYSQADCKTEIFGDGVWNNSARRQVVTIFDCKSAPYSMMVLGEVYNSPGCWSSYIPHSHDQPEVYYYRFDKPQGFGCCLIGDDAYRIPDRSMVEIPGGKTHPQVTAPGYSMYYCWMIAHLENNPWTDRINDPQHLWLLEPK